MLPDRRCPAGLEAALGGVVGLGNGSAAFKGWSGYGFVVSGTGQHRQFGHEGGALGMNGILDVRPTQGCTVAGLGNFDRNSVANAVTSSPDGCLESQAAARPANGQ